MDNLTIVVPFYNGHEHINGLLDTIPERVPVLIVDDQSDRPLARVHRGNVEIVRPDAKQYFSGAVNVGINRAGRDDVLVLNQDVRFDGTQWLDLLERKRHEYAYIGERIKGEHPAFPETGYIHGVFQFMRRDAIDRVGGLDAEFFPLWGGSAVWQWAAARAGFNVLPLDEVPNLAHKRRGSFGSSISQLLQERPDLKDRLIRTPPLVTVVIPNYNYGRFIADAIRSLFGGPTSLGEMDPQTFQGFEVIVVDDGSLDDSVDIVKSLQTPWNGLRLVEKPNGGTPSANNAGIEAALGKYVVLMCSDDMREPWSLRDLVRAQERHPDKVIYDDPIIFGDGERRDVMPLGTYSFSKLLQKNHVHMGIMFPKAAWEQVGGYPEEMRYGREDWAMNIRLGLYGWCGHKIDRPGYLYRRDGQNRTLTNTTPEWRDRFLTQLHALFPDAYQGELPMGCCGGRKDPKPVSVPQARPNAPAAIPQNMSAEQFVLVEYIGGNTGNAVWGGPGGSPSGMPYVFGNNPKNKQRYVLRQDLSWLIRLREPDNRDVPIFQEVEVTPQPEQVVSAPVEPEPEPAPDPNDLTVAEIRDLELTSDQWTELAEAELKGKGRVTVITHAKLQADK